MSKHAGDIAIVGMACRFPDASDYMQFWDNLKSGVQSIKLVPQDRWDQEQFYSDDITAPNKMNIRKMASIDGIDLFDHGLFNISPREAKSMDPQQRILLEETWHCIEDSGISLRRLQQDVTSVFVGVINTEYRQMIIGNGSDIDSYMNLGTFECVLANRISYIFDFKGTSMPINSACAASLVAVHEAKRSLRSGDSDYALVGGVNLTLDPARYISYSKARMFSPDGKCKTFDKDANGFVPGEGVGVLLLQRFDDALIQGNHIYGVLKGSSVNHSGKTISITAPSVEAQKKLVMGAYEDAEISPESVSYIETHGTGTTLGDPIEMEALTQSFQKYTDRKHYCYVGSVKTNIGHLESAAGIAALIKVLMMMRNRKVAPTLNCQTLNPIINFDHSPFCLANELVDWHPPQEQVPLRAGVSSFGFSGVNCHVLVEEYMDPPPYKETEKADTLFILSAKTAKSLEGQIKEWKSFVESDVFKNNHLKDICATLQTGRRSFAYRYGVQINSKEELKAYLKDSTAIYSYADKKQWHLCVGEGKWTGYTEEIEALVNENNIFAKHLNYVLSMVESKSKNFWDQDWERQFHSLYSFAVQYSYVRTLMELGFKPDLISANQSGIWVSLAISSMVKLEHVLDVLSGKKKVDKVPFFRPKILFYDPVRKQKILPWYFDENYLQLLKKQLFENENKYLDYAPEYIEKARLLITSQFTFKRYIEEWNETVKKEFGWDMITLLHDDSLLDIDHEEKRIERLLLMITIISALNKLNRKWGLSEKQQIQHDAFYELLYLVIDEVLTQKRFVQFLIGSGTHDQEIAKSLNQHQYNLNTEHSYPLAETLNQGVKEINHPHQWLSSAMSETNIPVIGGVHDILLGVFQNSRANDQAICENGFDLKATLLQLWLEGANFEWSKLYSKGTFRKVPLPVYNYTRRSFWPSNHNPTFLKTTRTIPHDKDISVRVYHQTVWEQANIKAEMRPDKFEGTLLILDDRTTLFDMLSDQLKNNSSSQVVLVQRGSGFVDKGSYIYEINPTKREDYDKLLASLKQRNFIPSTIIQHLSHEKFSADEQELCQQLHQGVYCLFYITQTLMGYKLTDGIKLLALSAKDQTHPQPQHEALYSYLRTVQQENPSFTCKYIQIDNSKELAEWSEAIWNEVFIEADTANHIRYTEKQRLIKCLEQVDVENQMPSHFRLHEDGAYILTGGTGGLGLIIAEYLANQANVSLVLTGRSPLDKEKVSNIDRLKALGAKVTYIQADVSNKNDVRKLIDQAKHQFKHIRGIIHSAGVYKSGLIMNKTVDEMEEILAPKVWGTVFLDKYTKDEPLDFFVMFSSIAGVVGDVGLSDYAYGNSFLDHYLEWREMQRRQHKRSGKTLSISWPLWAEGGMQLARVVSQQFSEQTGLKPLPTQEGVQAFSALTFHPYISHCLVSYGDEKKVQHFLDKSFGQEKAEVQKQQQDQTTPDLLYEQTERFLKEIISKELNVKVEEIDSELTFEEYGIDSIMIHHFNARLESELGSISKTLFFEYRYLNDLIDYFVQNHAQLLVSYFDLNTEEFSSYKEKHSSVNPNHQNNKTYEAEVSVSDHHSMQNMFSIRNYRQEDIAIIGVDGRYPGAKNLEEFWNNLVSGKDCITEIPSSRWDYRDYYDPNPEKADEGKIYCKWGGFLDDIDHFDPLLFNLSPREAESMDPQERLWLQTVWSTLEDAGYTRDQLRQYVAHKEQADIGVFVGVTTNSYQLVGVEAWRSGNDRLPHSLPWSLANRVSYVFNFNGPSMPVDTACSSSLTAIHLACESLRKGESAVAVAGGVNLLLHPMEYAFRCQKRMLSPTGKCHSFGENGDGYVPGEGVGAILLKPLNDAVADGDHIYAVIKGTAINHGGRTNGYTVPSPKAQADVITQALKQSEVDPRTISYVEAHGTGTSLGDPIEISGLMQAFNSYTDHKQYCSIGSVKSNIGHLESAAGISGLTKILLQMKHKHLVPSLHSDKINPNINLEETPFSVQKKLSEWKQPVIAQRNENVVFPRLAGISSFGAGGANAHIILEEYDTYDSNIRHTNSDHPSSNIIVLSSQSGEQLKEYAKRLYQFLAQDIDNASHPTDEEGLIDYLQQDMLSMIAEIIKINKESCVEADLGDYFVDPLHLKQLADRMNQVFSIQVSPALFSEYSGLADLTNCLFSEYKNTFQSYYENVFTHKEVRKQADLLNLSEVAYTLQVGREEMEERFAVVVSTCHDLMEALHDFYTGHTLPPNVYAGNAQRDKERFRLFTNGRAGHEFIKILVQDHEFDKLAQLWVSGVDIDWSILYADQRPKRISLPSYPYTQESYWLGKQESQITRKVQKIHQFLDRNISNFYEQRFSTQLKRSEFYLADHIIMGENVFPAVAMLEMARAAAELAGEKKVTKLKNIVWSKPITVGQHGQNIHIGLRPDENGAVFTITSMEHGDSDLLHSEGRVEFIEREGSTNEWIDLTGISNRCTQEISKATYYHRLEEIGLQYGPCFQSIESLSYGKIEALAELVLPGELPDDPDAKLNNFLLHPSMMDGALQSALVLLSGSGMDHTVLPFAIGEIEIIRPLEMECYAYVTMQEKQPASGVYRMNVKITDQRGQILVKVQDFTLRKSGQGMKRREDMLKLFQWLEMNEMDVAEVERIAEGYYEKESYTFE